VDGGNISGATGNILTINNAQTTNNGNYAVIVTNLAGLVISSNALLTVTNIPPVIETQPISQTVVVGSTVTFGVFGSDGTLPIFLQWQKDGVNLVDGTNLVNGVITSGATNNVLTIGHVQITNSGSYWLVITNSELSLTSSIAVLTVLPPPSFGNIHAVAGDSFILSGTGGVSNGTYYVLISSNLLVPLTGWKHIATNQFDSTGHFIFTNTAQTNAPQQFYLLQLP
jgi:hypothetical protein